MFLLETRDLFKSYTIGDTVVNAVDGISLGIAPGDFVCIMGPSGSGKTTLLNLLGCIDRPTSGAVLVEGRNVTALSAKALDRLRLLRFGFVFQRVNLIPILSAVENVELPMDIAGRTSAERRERALDLLRSVGLDRRAHHRPGQLSAGEQQRVGIARSLANTPALILADEPTGNLDTKTAAGICELLTGLNQSGQTIVMVTHDPEVAAIAARNLVIRDGRIAGQSI